MRAIDDENAAQTPRAIRVNTGHTDRRGAQGPDDYVNPSANERKINRQTTLTGNNDPIREVM